ncbi:phosphatidylserine/phosphatidylglycerophosphate/cardiolipin synthase-like enzyme [Sphingomonas jejuensis]|uniref:Phospholipase D n=1 Tax=Sphingomonas jejuensis TaxID=904715 RepID=A0ABX0XLJ6_9SPHN|nr:phospholipase D-like domain-containing protein [Sphingomonas jejuensis]NJC34243.1 phosphatidylserine/phosphatidylglycerophosphate/cardiolipin synthase-like enzyme [Sphingomonas jejuensis]
MIDDRAVWRIAEAERMSVIVDAEDYFRRARSAMLDAKKRIMLIGWDFDARIRLVQGRPADGGPAKVGDFIYWLVQRNPELEIYLLRWDMGAVKTLFRGTTIFTLFKWMKHPRIHTRLDAFHPTAASHHQKVVVIDDCIAFCGGIDMTTERWDRRDHADDDPLRRLPSGGKYKPWHDATSALQGPIAAALGELARDRWTVSGGSRLEAVGGVTGCWPDGLPADFEQVPVGIARTLPEMPNRPEVREVEALFLAQIAAARHSIYAESQYFASRKIAEAIARRLAEPDGPEIVIVHPEHAQGWLEPIAMDTARARLVSALRQRDKYNRLKLYHPFTAGGDAIYVHAKVMIVDGRTLRIGSANMNNRSLGLDTECDVIIDAGEDEAPAVRRIRDDLIAEHLGVSREVVAGQIDAQKSIIGAIESLRGPGRSLRPYEVPDLSGVETWLADNEVLDPESPSDMFESFA